MCGEEIKENGRHGSLGGVGQTMGSHSASGPHVPPGQPEPMLSEVAKIMMCFLVRILFLVSG